MTRTLTITVLLLGPLAGATAADGEVVVTLAAGGGGDAVVPAGFAVVGVRDVDEVVVAGALAVEDASG